MPDIGKIKYWRKRARRAEKALHVEEMVGIFIISYLKRRHPAVYAEMATYQKNQRRIKERLFKNRLKTI